MNHPEGFIKLNHGVSRASTGGFTLVEMLTVIAMSAILLAIALPSFNSLIERYRVNAKANALQATLSFARAEAIRRGAPVTIKAREKDKTCALAISTDDWSCGWDVQFGSGGALETLKSEPPDEVVGVMGEGAQISFDAFGRSLQWTCFVVTPQPDGIKSSNTVALKFSAGGLVRRNAGDICDK